MAHFFIRRPVFAVVLSLLIVLVGTISLFSLPVAQYPPISPPTVSVSTAYVGANAETVEQAVAAPIEQQVNGAENMIYMQSRSNNNGTYQLTCTFKVGADLEMAAVEVQNRISQATPSLPAEVTQSGVTIRKQSPNIVQIVNLYSPGDVYDDLFLSNYAMVYLVDELARVPGVGNVQLGGGRNYAMRFWLQPSRLAQLGVTASDVIGSITEQNIQAPVGGFGLPPAPPGQLQQFSARTKGRLTDVSEFENIVVRSRADGSILHLRDVARAELGAQDYSASGRLNGAPSAAMLIFQLPGSNALDVTRAVEARMKELAKSFPPGLAYRASLDTTKFVSASIDEVVKTLVEAMLLVLVVVFLFLGNWRATLIPMLAVPVSLVGTFASFVVLGFSINLLTLFAMILAIGIVVDDAIVVVEAVQHHIEQGMEPVAATRQAMTEVSGPVVGIALVLTSVFVPVAALGGVTGQLYRQFALTLSVSVMLSALVALSLTPALCARLLKPHAAKRGPVGALLDAFNRRFMRSTDGYVRWAHGVIRFAPLSIGVLALIYFGAWGLARVLPTSFLPQEDLGYVLVNLELPDASAVARTQAAMDQGSRILAANPAVQNVVSLTGFGMLSGANTSNVGTYFVMLKPWDERSTPALGIRAVMASIGRQMGAIPDATVTVVNPPPIMGLGASGGFQFELQDRSGGDSRTLTALASAITADARKEKSLGFLFSGYRPNVPQVAIDVDRERVKTLGVPLNSVYQALQAYLGGFYVNQFNLYGRTLRVYVQADPTERSSEEDLGGLYARNGQGGMVPLNAFVSTRRIVGPESIMRFNMYRAAEIQGQAAPGYSSGDAIATMERLAGTLPGTAGYAWTGTAYQEKESGAQQGKILVLALVFVFLCLAALYESWSIPFSVLLGVPIGMIGAFGAVYLRGISNDIYVQIGLIMLIGLAAKNAILIVEFAKTRHEEHGLPLVEAALTGARLRFRPILMTSFAFILGVLPMVISTGAGAGSRHSIGTAVCFGMLTATAIGVFAIPLLYVLVERLKEQVVGVRVVAAPAGEGEQR